MWRLMQRETPDDCLFATGQTHSLREFAASVFAELGLELDKYLDIDQALLRPTEVLRNELDPARAKSLLGWSASSAMPDVTKHLVACDLKGELGPLPWQPGALPDLGAEPEST
jgi:GDPmannose 4,6-dehydratase